METLLRRLDQFILDNPTRAVFEAPATADAIAKAEAAIGLPLPVPYKAFLAAHDGGFFSVPWETTNPRFDKETAGWNSNILFGCERLVASYQEICRFSCPNSRSQFIPFCQTKDQELLVFGPPSEEGNRRVLDAFHETGSSEWNILYSSFENLLRDYIDKNGDIQTIGYI